MARLLLRALLSVACVVTVAGPARSDWQFTRWGMSLNDLLAVPNQAIRKTTIREQQSMKIGPSDDALATGSYVADRIVFDAWYYFDKDRLSGVKLKVQAPQDAAWLMKRLESIYGEPDKLRDEMSSRTCRDISMEWIDLERNTEVTFYNWSCTDGSFHSSINYWPATSKSESGL